MHFVNRSSKTICAAIVATTMVFALPKSLCAQEPQARQLVKAVGIDQNLNAQVSLELPFRDESGRTVELGKYFDKKPVLLALVYYRCPMLCTEVLNGLLKSAQSLKLQIGTDYEIVCVSIDPKETASMAAAKKVQYVKRYRRSGAQEGWHFLTGDQPSIDELAKTVGFRYQYDPTTDQYAHASGIMALTPDGRISRYFYGIDFHPYDLRLGLVESSEGRIGTAVDQFLLLCYHYDPKTGKYGLVISRVMQLAGAATVLVLGGYLLSMYQLERRRSAAVAHEVVSR